ncbi:hypothetical protein CHS0354_008482 [Potamilus streckersoni]|uniref:C2H2-type domain-containing protein n=1 Tax=Potamilus streckersoni TaxID=2493646 RepID=A0AAE0RPT1_9BIVA|nr:hypothetical protein CHS0354_008482 [Potamilus streckersoni]
MKYFPYLNFLKFTTKFVFVSTEVKDSSQINLCDEQKHREFCNTPHHSDFGTLSAASKSSGDGQRAEREVNYYNEEQYHSIVHNTIFHPSCHNKSFANNPPSNAKASVDNAVSDIFNIGYWSNVACTRGNIHGREMNKLTPDQVECFSSVDKMVTFSKDIIKEISTGLSQSESHGSLVHSSPSKNQEYTVPEYYTRHSPRGTGEGHLKKSRNGLSRQKSKSNTESKSQSIRLYICQYCGKTFSLKGNFERHVRSHTGERPYPCNICGQGLGDKRSLFEHMQRHTGAHLYKCAHCDKSFRFHSEHIKHVRKFH